MADNEQVLSVFRTEQKYYISKTASANLRRELDQILTRDEHSSKDGYMVRSLYFDTINNRDYMTKMDGDESRYKIRIRVYSHDSQSCKLEVKKKDDDLESKISIWIDKSDAEELARLNYSVLTKYFSQSQDAVYLYTLLQRGVYRPVVLTEYDRLAYIYPLFDTRITLDSGLKSSESNFDLFCEDPGYTKLLNEKDILEIKYNEKLVRFISDIMKKYNLTRCSASKYCISRKVFCDFNF